ncbi:cytochrome B561 [Methylocella silvestris BL2]|uniref:Cytochrome B561 n=1 Tax=Methylocella silvestris (strain DSM 15510 / CIP 108128 / LMG 27833 / NCIMB 13906 / BL2) TaxID=395965 RepID=B8EN10_METSB|nr:cytochrome b/b6 domain-containing protein [Methylocella silvestris]ACK49145.1 cytochrome B561 [Methylocella silvestris BL2]
MADAPAATYDKTTISLHWASAGLIALLWIGGQTGDWFSGQPKLIAWSTHVTLGFALTLVLVWRLVWRRSSGRHLPPANSGALQILAQSTHHLLYGLLLIVLALGIVNAFVRGFNLFGVASLPQLGDREWRKPITELHGLAANILLGLAFLHAAAALAHHYLLKDGVLSRMLPERASEKPSVH